MKNVIKNCLLLLCLIPFLTACNQESKEGNVEEKDEKLKVYTTIYPIQFFAEQIGAEFVEVTNIIPVGSDAHTYEPTAKTMTEITSGDLFIYNGAGIEGFVDSLLPILEKENIEVIKAVEGINLNDSDHEHHDHDELGHSHDEHDESGHHDDEHEHYHGEKDPHVWLDPILAIEMAENIKNSFVAKMPDHAQIFENNFAALKSELEAIDQEFVTMLKSVSKDQFIVSHAGYGYWESRYGIKQLPVAGLSPTNEPSVKQIEALIDTAKTIGAKYIAFEKNMTVKVAETVQKEANLEVIYLYNIESLTEENMRNGENYFDLMRKNIEALQQLLQ